MSVKVFDVVKPGVVLGDDVQKLFQVARENGFAIPAVNVVGTNSVNAVMEAARVVNSPVIIQFSNGGAAFWSGKGISNEAEKSAIAGAVIGAKHVHHWLNSTESPFCCIPTMRQGNFCHGLTDYWMQERNILRAGANLYTALTCWTFRKSRLKKISRHARGILRG